MGFVSIFGKSMMKNAYLPKISILLQFGGEIKKKKKILALLCPNDSIQILLILSQFLIDELLLLNYQKDLTECKIVSTCS